MNECHDHLRKKRARPLVYETDLSEEQVSRLDGIVSSCVSRYHTPGEDMEAKETIYRILGSLSEGDRRRPILREIEGFSIQELADILNLNLNTVKYGFFAHGDEPRMPIGRHRVEALQLQRRVRR